MYNNTCNFGSNSCSIPNENVQFKEGRNSMNKTPINKDGETDDVNYDDDLLSEYGDVDEIDNIDDLEGY